MKGGCRSAPFPFVAAKIPPYCLPPCRIATAAAETHLMNAETSPVRAHWASHTQRHPTPES